MSTRRAWVRPLAGFAVALAFVWLLARTLDWHDVQRTLRAASAPLLVQGLLFLAAGLTVRIVRWWWMLRAFAPELPVRSCVRPFLASLALNNTVPLRAGDVSRVFGFRDELRTPPVRVLGTLVIERVLDLVVLLAIFFAGLLGAVAGSVPARFVVVAGATGALVVGVVLVVLLAPQQIGRAVRFVLGRGPWADRPLAARIAAGTDHFLDALLLMRSPARALQLLAMSLVAWGFEGGMYASVASALSTGAAPLAPWFALSTGTLATLLPSSPGYVGTFDFFAMLGLTAYGAAAAKAGAFALLVHLILWVPVTVVGGLLLLAPAGPRPDAQEA
jgi:glycosyltransferase 2 family protein